MYDAFVFVTSLIALYTSLTYGKHEFVLASTSLVAYRFARLRTCRAHLRYSWLFYIDVVAAVVTAAYVGLAPGIRMAVLLSLASWILWNYQRVQESRLCHACAHTMVLRHILLDTAF